MFGVAHDRRASLHAIDEIVIASVVAATRRWPHDNVALFFAIEAATRSAHIGTIPDDVGIVCCSFFATRTTANVIDRDVVMRVVVLGAQKCKVEREAVRGLRVALATVAASFFAFIAGRHFFLFFFLVSVFGFLLYCLLEKVFFFKLYLKSTDSWKPYREQQSIARSDIRGHIVQFLCGI